MKITITIQTGNAAFEDGNSGSEVARILRKYADRIEHDEPDRCNLLDVNGNTVGQVKVTGKRS